MTIPDKFFSNSKAIKMRISTFPAEVMLKANKEVRRDKELAKIAVEKEMDTIRYIDDSLRNDRDFILGLALKNSGDGYILKYLPEKFASDKEVIS